EAFFCSNVVAVLRPWRIATDFRLIIDGFAVSVGAQEIKTMARPLLCLELKSVISGTSLILDRSKGPEFAIARPKACRFAIGRQCWIICGLWSRDLIEITKYLKMSAFRADVCRCNQNLPGQLKFEIQ